MRINIGIVGYGNLGKSVEKEILKNKNFNLVSIFSRRQIISVHGTTVEPYENFKEYKNKIDIMILCGGSLSDLEWQTREISQFFDCINSFDTHSKLKLELETLSKITHNNHHRVIIACGWDPGIFSIVRSLFYTISHEEPITFWGKGISMGHSDAIRKQPNVDDAVEFTIPNKVAVCKAKAGILDSSIPRHFRECYVVSNSKNKDLLTHQIKNIPNYFKGQPTTVHYVSNLDLLKLKSKMSHKGEIVSNFLISKNKNKMFFSVKMQSNPEFTARVMVAYTKAIVNMKKKNISGAFTPVNIPISFHFDENDTIATTLW